MKHIQISVLIVCAAVEFLTAVEARFVLEFPYVKHGSNPSHVEQVRPTVEDFPGAADSNPAGRRNCSCDGSPSINVHMCECAIYVNDPTSGIRGNFTLDLINIFCTFCFALSFNGYFIVDGCRPSGPPAEFTTFACNESKITNLKPVCLFTEVQRLKLNGKVTGCAYLMIVDTESPLAFDFGCFGFDRPSLGAKTDDTLITSLTNGREFLSGYAGKEGTIVKHIRSMYDGDGKL